MRPSWSFDLQHLNKVCFPIIKILHEIYFVVSTILGTFESMKLSGHNKGQIMPLTFGTHVFMQPFSQLFVPNFSS